MNYYDPRHKNRESLWSLDQDTLYIVEGVPSKGKKYDGTISAVYETRNDREIRFAIKDVLVRRYDKNVALDASPVVAIADHLNCIRPKRNTERMRLDGDERLFFIGKPKVYYTEKMPDGAITMNLYADINIAERVIDLHKRIRLLNTEWNTTNPREVPIRVNKTQKLIEDLERYIADYFYVPWYDLKQTKEHLSVIKRNYAKQTRRLELYPPT